MLTFSHLFFLILLMCSVRNDFSVILLYIVQIFSILAGIYQYSNIESWLKLLQVSVFVEEYKGVGCSCKISNYLHSCNYVRSILALGIFIGNFFFYMESKGTTRSIEDNHLQHKIYLRNPFFKFIGNFAQRKEPKVSVIIMNYTLNMYKN